MRKRNRFIKWLFRIIIAILLLLAGFFMYLMWVSKINPPVVTDKSSLNLQRNETDTGFFAINDSWLQKNKYGLYELYTSGKPFERGVIEGKLTEELVQKQEDYFSDQINKMVPSKFYRYFLKYFIGWFNRHLAQNIADEYKQEIYGISFSASDNYGYIGDKYSRILNYHAAHDIGHALQNLALVGCTSFGTWGSASQDGNLIIGRNFDFYVGDDFAKNKIVSFVTPSVGYRFMSVTWGGFIGVVSGMNEKGLTVTINAAKSEMPTGSATPVSLVAREIVQYAKNINEAIAIAKKRKMFVSESFLVGSAIDNKAVVIEKTPDSLAVYDPKGNEILCTNHFQSQAFYNMASNQEQMESSASVYRYKRLSQLLQENGKNTVAKTVKVLRDYKGLNHADIGLGNEKAVNQFIAHHSIVFEPQKLLVWVSTAPWQMGSYVAYDLKKVFGLNGLKKNEIVYEPQLTILPDSLIYTKQFQQFQNFRKNKYLLSEGKMVVSDSIIADNPSYYNTYVVAADALYKAKEYGKALRFYQKAASLEIATLQERNYILTQIQNCKQKL